MCGRDFVSGGELGGVGYLSVPLMLGAFGVYVCGREFCMMGCTCVGGGLIRGSE